MAIWSEYNVGPIINLTKTPIHLERQPVLYVNIVCENM